MSAIPHVAIAYDNGISGHFSGVDLDPEGYWIEFSLREGLDGSDIIIVRQQVWDDEHEMSLDKALSIARRDLSNNLALLAEDIRNGEVRESTDDQYTNDEIDEDSLKVPASSDSRKG